VVDERIPDALTTLRAVVDPVRLAVLGASVVGPVSIDRLADELGVPRRTVAKAIGALRNEGLLDGDAMVDQAALRAVAEAIPSSGSSHVPIEGPWTPEEAEILGRFFEDGRLITVPTQAAKRFLVLEKVAQEFEPGRRYSERDVNFKIQMIHSDYAAIRRYMVDNDLMDRADGAYWRTGGRYSVPEANQTVEIDRREILPTEIDGVVLRAYTWDMAEAIVAAADDPRVPRYMGDMFPTPYTIEAAHEWLAIAGASTPTTQYAIFLDDRFVGGVGGFPSKAENTGAIEIGWWLTPDVWGRGITTAAARALVDELFSQRGAMRLWAPVMRPNVASAKVAMNAGLVLEGIAPDAYLKGGVRYDQMSYGLTRSQWQA
jgi:RimJ/RimL family protein N-acetyltransferase